MRCQSCNRQGYLPDGVICGPCDDALFASIAGDTYPTQQDIADDAWMAMSWEAKYASL